MGICQIFLFMWLYSWIFYDITSVFPVYHCTTVTLAQVTSSSELLQWLCRHHTNEACEFLPFHILVSLCVSSDLDFDHSNRCVVVSHYCNLQFHNDIWGWASFQVIWHLFIFFGVFGPFFGQDVCFLITEMYEFFL